jgi:PhzF family phenazine biosynthesis protein
MSGQRIVQVDAFTNRPYAGNQAAVCVLEGLREEAWMQALARETNLPATVFLSPQEDGFAIRWLTPASELPLCGHGTLAAAHVLWTEGHADPARPIALYSRNHRLKAVREDDWITLDFPAIRNAPVTAPVALVEGLGLQPRFVGRSSHSYLVEANSEEEVRGLKPDFGRLATLDFPSIIVTARSNGAPYDFVSRCFPLSHGIQEDPATGSAHCCFGPYWSEILGKTQMIGYQASARGGVVRVRVDGERVALSGQAVTVLRGELCEP